MFKLLADFIKVFGDGFRLSMVFLFLGGILNGFLELFGVMLIFPLMQLIDSPAEATQGVFLGRAYHYLGTPSPKMMVLYVSICVWCVYLFRAVVQIGMLNYENRVLSRWKNIICSRLFTLYMGAEYRFHLSKSSSETINTISRSVNLAINENIYFAISLMSNVCIGLFLFVFLFTEHPFMTIIIGVLFFALFKAQGFIIRRKLEAYSRQIVGFSKENISAVSQGLAAYKDTKMGLKEGYFIKKFNDANKSMMDVDGRLIFYRNLPVSGTELIVISMMVAAFNMLMFSNDGKTSITVSLAGLVMTVLRMVPVVNRSLTSWTTMNSSAGYVRALLNEAKLLNYAKQVPQFPDAKETSPLVMQKGLFLRNLSFSYAGEGLLSLDGISVSIPKGQFWGIIGASGAGKTTLIGVLLGFLPAGPGQYFIDDLEIKESNIRSLRKTIGYVDQNPYIFEGSIEENVAFGISEKDINPRRIEKALRQADLWNFVQGHELGTKSPVGENGKLLSGGQRQRLALARALYKEPDILILDEATSALDVETEQRISETIAALKGKVTIIAIAHRLSTLKACDQLIMMKNGRIGCVGRLVDLMEENEDFRNMVNMSSIGNSQS